MEKSKLFLRVSLIGAALAIGYSLYTDPDYTRPAPMVTLNDAVTGKSVDSLMVLLNQYNNSGAKTLLLKITSPGGEVMKGREVIALMQEPEMKVSTYADNYFMSMGMSFFLEGETRLVTKNAIGMIHRGSVGGMTYAELKAQLEMDPENEQLRMLVESMDILFEPEFKKLEEIKKTAPNPAYTQEIIDDLKKGNHDIFLNADQLIASGIATHIVSGVKEAQKIAGKA